jgi:hypothetical protein
MLIQVANSLLFVGMFGSTPWCRGMRSGAPTQDAILPYYGTLVPHAWQLPSWRCRNTGARDAWTAAMLWWFSWCL